MVRFRAPSAVEETVQAEPPRVQEAVQAEPPRVQETVQAEPPRVQETVQAEPPRVQKAAQAEPPRVIAPVAGDLVSLSSLSTLVQSFLDTQNAMMHTQNLLFQRIDHLTNTALAGQRVTIAILAFQLGLPSPLRSTSI